MVLEEEVVVKFKRWRDEMESKALCVNVDKTKVMVSGVGCGGKFGVALCKKGVGRNLVMCYVCDG